MKYKKLKRKNKFGIKALFNKGIQKFYPVTKRMALKNKKEELQFINLNKQSIL